MAKSPDPRQPSLFEQRPARPGSLGFGAELRSALARAIKECPKSRAVIAAEMTDLIFGDGAGEGSQVTVAMLDSWTAPSREAWRFPVEYLPAFVGVTASAHWLLDVLVEKCGGRVLLGEAAAFADLAAIEIWERDLAAAKRAIKQRIDPSAPERLMRRNSGGRQ